MQNHLRVPLTCLSRSLFFSDVFCSPPIFTKHVEILHSIYIDVQLLFNGALRSLVYAVGNICWFVDVLLSSILGICMLCELYVDYVS